MAGSLAAILWNASHGLDPAAGERIWRGWVIGDFLQLALVAVSVLSGIQNVLLGWNDIPLRIGGIELDVTVYPPLILAVVAALWLGPAWGAIPIYLANAASAWASGLSLPMSALFAEALRTTDLLFRFGGEEFVVLMPHTHSADVREAAERLRAILEGSPLAELPTGAALAVTASIGAVATDRFPVSPAEIVGKADDACYEAKRLGRNRVVVAQAERT